MSARLLSVMSVTASMPVTTVMVSEAPTVSQDSQHMTVPVLLIWFGILVVVKITSTVSGSIRNNGEHSKQES